MAKFKTTLVFQLSKLNKNLSQNWCLCLTILKLLKTQHCALPRQKPTAETFSDTPLPDQHFHFTDKFELILNRCVTNSITTLTLVKFIYSEQVTKFCKISTLLSSVYTVDKSKVEISQNFVAFSEYTNFKYIGSICIGLNVQPFQTFFWHTLAQKELLIVKICISDEKCGIKPKFI